MKIGGLSAGIMNNKCMLNEYCQEHRMGQPYYDTEILGGSFSCTVTVNGDSYESEEVHTTKKAAQQDAAGVALQSLQPRRQRFGLPRPVMPSLPPVAPPRRFLSISPSDSPSPDESGSSVSISSFGRKGLIGRGPPDKTPPKAPPRGRSKPRNFGDELQQYCQSRDLSPPEYCTSEKGGRFVSRVKVGGAEYGGSKDYDSWDLAKENATLTALACIGLQALDMSDGGTV